MSGHCQNQETKRLFQNFWVEKIVLEMVICKMI